ncbi:DUF1592 domain-containing protein [Tautonia marina]|uniref:DUF1592 domain-containing protein n=1 Tax=Tautonia marina TaxID=2653855 RepID=UPI00126041E4|nr:DUF1592 domain-containing protein [Tautonia marina]
MKMLFETRPRRRSLALGMLVMVGLLGLPMGAATAAQDKDDPIQALGLKVYQQSCAECHGENGEGSQLDYPHPLHGDKTLEGLTTYIDEKMPPGFEDEVTGEDAEAVARYVYDAFYSEIAQARNAPARIELARLTVDQYRNTVSDLIASFRGRGQWPDERGLQGEYYSDRGFRRDRKQIERIDPELNFDFGIGVPDGDTEKFDKRNQFSARWQGSLMPPESGTYEFVVWTEHAVRLFVNDERTPLIDGWVQSGDDRERRASIPLLAGRPYRIRLEFSKAYQGVRKDDDEPEIPATIRLSWVPPRRAEEVIPSRYLSPQWAPQVFVVTTPFPPDDRSVGYERGTTISAAWSQASTDAAIETAAYVVEHLNDLAKVKDDDPEREIKLRDFAASFVERAFRRPLDPEQRDLYVDRQFDTSPNTETAIKRVVLLALKSPRFLYHEIDPELDPYAVASRISYALWDSLPDDALMKAAAEGRLETRDQVAEQARRMLDDPRARAKVLDFFRKWLKIDDIPDLAKDPELFAEFTPEVISDLRTSLELFLEDVIWNSDAADFRRLLLDEPLMLNGRLAAFYGADLPEDSPFAPVAEGIGQRAGLLSHPYLMANFAYTSESSPIFRGVFLARNVLGVRLRPPQEAFAPLAPDLHPDLTTRERTALQTSPESCMSCHALINPLGFALEHYDAVGRFREQDNGKPIDATGLYQTRTGDTATFEGVRELAAFLAASDEVADAFVERLFQHQIKQPIRAFGPETLPDLRDAFVTHDYNIQTLLVDIVAESALTPRQSAELASTGE